MRTPLIFDGHNDVLTRLWSSGAGAAGFGKDAGAINAPAARKGGLGGGFFALWVPSPPDGSDSAAAMLEQRYDLPLPGPVARDTAMEVVTAQAAIFDALVEAGELVACRTVEDLRAALAGDGGLAAILHLEGAECIGPDLAALDRLHARGLRSLGPVWSRPTIFGHGVPFRFPSTGDTGPGLTEAGKRLVARCHELGVLVDLSHMTEAGFWDVAGLERRPLVATHSNAHAICPSARNLTDRQLDAIADSDGMVGINFGTAFLREDGKRTAETGLDPLLRHLDYLIGRLGEDRVGFGSDYDGTLVPEALTSSADLPVLREALRGHGIDDAMMQKLCHENWLRVLDLCWR